MDKFNARAQAINSIVCVGLDPDFAKIPDSFKELPYPQYEFNKWIIDQTAPYTAAYKPNTAFYEARGEQGIHELKLTMDYINENYPTIFTISDAKRADIGNTNNGYVSFMYDYLGFDSVTLHPYLGSEALEPFLARQDKTSIILCRTSNAGAGEFQDIIDAESGKTMWQIVAHKVETEWSKIGNCMLVVGATYPEEMAKIREIAPHIPFLVPGVGAQGGSVEDVMSSGRDENGQGLIINSARGIIFNENPAQATKALRDEINNCKN